MVNFLSTYPIGLLFEEFLHKNWGKLAQYAQYSKDTVHIPFCEGHKLQLL